MAHSRHARADAACLPPQKSIIRRHFPPRSYREFVSEIEYLQANNFVDDATRAIFVDAVFYNTAFGLYASHP
jgi:hypothetical protein